MPGSVLIIVGTCQEYWWQSIYVVMCDSKRQRKQRKRTRMYKLTVWSPSTAADRGPITSLEGVTGVSGGWDGGGEPAVEPEVEDGVLTSWIDIWLLHLKIGMCTLKKKEKKQSLSRFRWVRPRSTESSSGIEVQMRFRWRNGQSVRFAIAQRNQRGINR